MSTTVTEVQTAVAEFDKVAAGIAILKDKYAGVVYEVQTPKGMEAAKAARAAVREPRYEVERVRKAAKAPIVALGKQIDDRAKEITAGLLAIEEPIDQQIKNEDARKEAEKQAKIDAELKRVADLQERVAELRGNQLLSSANDPKLIAEHIADLEKIVIDDSFQEFGRDAQAAKETGLARLRDMHTAALARVAEQERIKAERAELEKLRREQAERDRLERERIAAEEKVAREKREAEERVQREELRKQKEELDRQEREARQAREAEARKLAAERAEFERQQREAREAKDREEKLKAEQARIASIQRPTDEEIVSVLAAHYNVPTKKAIEWLAAYDQKAAA